jgi:hypothetical protein
MGLTSGFTTGCCDVLESSEPHAFNNSKVAPMLSVQIRFFKNDSLW